MSDDRQRFDEFLGKFGKCYGSIQVRAICGMREAQWWNIWTRVDFDAEAPADVSLCRDLPDTEAIRCRHVTFPVEKAKWLLDSVERDGRLRVDDTEVLYSSDNSGKWKPGLSLSRYYFVAQDNKLNDPAEAGEWSYARLYGDGSNVSADFALKSRDLDLHLQVQRAPFEDLRELLEDFGGSDTSFGMNTRGNVLVCAPIMLDLGNRGFADDRLRFTVRGEPSFLDLPMHVGVIELPHEGPKRRYPIDIPKTGWHEEGDEVAVELETPVAAGSFVTLVLVVDGFPASFLQLQEPSLLPEHPRMLAHAFFDVNGLLSSYLSEGQEDSHRHEQGVTWLLHLCKMSSARYGIVNHRNEVDVVAFCDDPPTVVAAECTSDALKAGDKIGELLRRSSELKAKLGDRNMLPVLFVSASGCALTKEERERARAGGVSIMDASRTEDMVKKARRGISAREAIEFLRKHVPSAFDLADLSDNAYG